LISELKKIIFSCKKIFFHVKALSFIDKKINGLEQSFRRTKASSALVAKVGKE